MTTDAHASVDDLLREASDPTTSSERLLQIRAWLDEAMPLRDGVTRPKLRLLQQHLDRNPSLPTEVLLSTLLLGNTDAWYNPAVSLAMASQPDKRYEEAASACLRYLQLPAWPPVKDDEDEDPGPLAARIDSIARDMALVEVVDGELMRGQVTPELRALARRIAELFGLPWPETTAGE